MPSATGLHLLLGTADPHRFFDEVWEREPRLFPSVLDGTGPLLSREAFELLLGSPLQGGDTGISIIEGQVARPAVGRDGSGPRLDAVHTAYAAGATLLMTRLQHRSQAIAHLAADIEHDLRRIGMPMIEAVSANAYLTPPWAQGFGAHHDDHCALVVQVAGRKSWSVFAPVDTMPVEPCATAYSADELGKPVLEATVDAGDVLYVPRGFPHVAWCRDEDSLHLTFSLRAMTWGDAIASLCHAEPQLRRSIGPLAGDAGRAAISHFAAVVRPAIEELPMAELLDKGGARHRADTSGPGRLGAIAASRRIGRDTLVERVPGLDCATSEADDAAVLRFGTDTIELDAAMAPVFRFIAAHDEFVIGNLPAIDRPYDAVELAAILVERGLLRTAGASAPSRPEVGREAEAQQFEVTVDAPARSRGLPRVRVLHRQEPPSAPGLDWITCADRIPALDCDEMVAACRESPESPPSTVGEERYPDHRRGAMRKLALTPRTEWIFDLLRDVATEATRSYFGLELTSIVRAPQYVEYMAGQGHFLVHNDYSHDQAITPRKLTIIMQLSDPADYTGGRLRVYGNEVEDLPDGRGTVVAFPSFVFHEVTPVELGVRRALVAWIAGPRLR